MYTLCVNGPSARSHSGHRTIGEPSTSVLALSERRSAWRVLAPSLLSILALLGGCISSETTTRQIDVDDPKSTSGILVKDPDDNALDRLIAQFERAQDETAVSDMAAGARNELEPRKSLRTRGNTRPASRSSWPVGIGKVLDLPSMSEIELREFLDDLALALQAQNGYERASDDTARSVPPLPTGLFHERLLCLKADQGDRVLRIGCWSYKSRTPRLGVYGAVMRSGQSMQTNPDQTGVETLVEQILANVEQARLSLRAVDLDHKTTPLHLTG